MRARFIYSISFIIIIIYIVAEAIQMPFIHPDCAILHHSSYLFCTLLLHPLPHAHGDGYTLFCVCVCVVVVLLHFCRHFALLCSAQLRLLRNCLELRLNCSRTAGAFCTLLFRLHVSSSLSRSFTCRPFRAKSQSTCYYIERPTDST